MKNKVKQILSVVMSVSMLSTMIPLTTYGAEFDSAESAVTVEDETPVSEDVNVSGDESTDSSATSTEDAFQSGDAEDPFSADDEDAFSAGDEEDTDVFADTPEAEDFDYVTSNASVSLTDRNMRIFHLDAGRKYFSVEQIKNLIDTLNENGYNYMELAVGNDALRFLLDDMSVEVDGTSYTSDQITAGIQTGNQNYCRNNENADTNTLSESDMDTIISYAKGKNISIIPLLNSPGHMDSIIDCMKSLGMTNVAFNGSARTIDVSNTAAVKFTTALIQKYVNYFSGKGCRIFNMGADEYANDVSNDDLKGFAGLINQGKYNLFVYYVNSIASMIKNAGMVPMAFNDGIYYNETIPSVNFDADIAIAYWTVGWPGYSPASAAFLAGKGHKIINTNDAWYYVLGRDEKNTSGYTIATALKGVKNTKYTDVPGENDPAVCGAMVCLWCDTPSVSYSDSEANNVANILKTFATNNSDVFQTKEPDKEPDNGAVEENKRTINLVVGGIATDTIKGYNYKGQTVETEDTSIATVEVTDGKSVGDTQESYPEANVTYKNLINSDSSAWNKTNYYYSPDGINYYPLWAKRTSQRGNYGDTYYNYYWGYGESENNITSASSDNWIYSGNSSSSSPKIKVYSKTTTTVAEASTELKFTGVAIGTTVATIGNVVYTITVSEKAPDGAMTNTSINLEYWITNFVVHETNSESSAEYTEITTSTDKATTDEGIAITDIAPNLAYSFFDGTKEVCYWQTMRLDSDNIQTNVSGDDKTADGTTLTHVRYHSGAWQYKTIDGIWHYFVSTDQLVAYYLQKTEVTKEIDTYAKDWGYSTSGTTNDTSSGKGQVALTVAVVYLDGTVSPAESSMYAKSTTIFNYWDGRDIGIVAPQNNSDYDISKITVTDGERKTNTSANVWYTNDSIEWTKKTLDSGDKWYDETVVWEESDGTTPMVNGKNSNITWSAKNKAKLVLIYLKPIVKATNLNVKYVCDSENETSIAEYQIAMSFNQGDPEPTFAEYLNPKPDVTTGTFTLDDDAYVTNSSGVNQYISKNLAIVANTQKISDIKYLSGSYKYVSAEISEDGKTLILHYNIDETQISMQYVVDFGAKVNVPLSDLVDKNAIGGVTKVEASNNATVNADKSVTYTPVRALTGKDIVTVKITYSSNSAETRQLAFVPATTIYYEETFVEGGTGATNLETPQEKAKPGDTQTSSAANYGYDSIYAKDGAMSSNGSTDIQGIRKEFTFTGTGVDIYANTGTATGTMMIYVKKDNNIINMVAVDTKMKNGSTDATEGQEVDGKNVPVATLNMGTYAKYTVVIQGVKTGKEGLKPVYFDGYRVYNTLNDDSSAATYAKDKEANPSYCELRDQVLHAINVDAVIGNKGDGTSQYAKQVAKNTLSQVYASSGITNAISAIVLSKENADGDSSVINPNPQDLLDNGPKNELYLRNGQIVTFKLNKTAQIGLKGVNGDATFTINGTQKSVSTTDMFYPVSSGTITIKNTSDNLLSITKIKAFIGSNNASEETVASALFAPLSEDDLVPAMIALGYEADPVPTEIPQPSVTATPSETPEPSVTATPSETPAPTTDPENPVKLSAPKLGKVTSVSYNSVKVTWSKVKNADGYRVYMKVNGKWKSLGKTGSASYTCKGLKTGQKYTFTVRAYKNTSDGVVLSSYDKKGISGTPELSTPVLSSVKRTSSGVIFKWKKTAGANNGYVVYRKANNGEWRAAAKVTKGTTYKDTTAKKGVKYTYTVRALRKSGTTSIYSTYNAKGISVK